MICGYYDSPIGWLRITSEDNAIVSIQSVASGGITCYDSLIKTCIQQLEEYFNNKRKDFDFEYRLEGTEFQKMVWQALIDVDYGSTMSYQDIANNIGRRKAVRAVANAVGANNLLIVVPCHRIIYQNGKLGGFSCGIEKKKVLQQIEGISLR